MDPSELVALIATLNPENTPGRLAVIVRMGAVKLREKLPALIEAVQQAGQVVAWVCDPMHGNTEEVNGYKTRRYDNIRAEVGGEGEKGRGCGPPLLAGAQAGPRCCPPCSCPALQRTLAWHPPAISPAPQVEAFFDVHDEVGSVPGGIHLEMTGERAAARAGEAAGVCAATAIRCSCRFRPHSSLPACHQFTPDSGSRAHAHPSGPLPRRRQRDRVHRRRRMRGRGRPEQPLPHALRPAAERGAGARDGLLRGLPPAAAARAHRQGEAGPGQAGAAVLSGAAAGRDALRPHAAGRQRASLA